MKKNKRSHCGYKNGLLYTRNSFLKLPKFLFYFHLATKELQQSLHDQYGPNIPGSLHLPTTNFLNK